MKDEAPSACQVLFQLGRALVALGLLITALVASSAVLGCSALVLSAMAR